MFGVIFDVICGNIKWDKIEFNNENVINVNPRFMFRLSFFYVCHHTSTT